MKRSGSAIMREIEGRVTRSAAPAISPQGVNASWFASNEILLARPAEGMQPCAGGDY